MQAAVLNYKLETYDEDIERRREIARMYDAALTGLNDISLPPGPDHGPESSRFGYFPRFSAILVDSCPKS